MEIGDNEDPVDKLLKKTGCIDLHYKVQVSKNVLNFYNFLFVLKL